MAGADPHAVSRGGGAQACAPLSKSSEIRDALSATHAHSSLSPGVHASPAQEPVYCYCFHRVWSDQVLELHKDHLHPYRLCGATTETFSSSGPDCSREGMYPHSIFDNPGPWSGLGNTSTTGLGRFVSYAADVRTGSEDGINVDQALLNWYATHASGMRAACERHASGMLASGGWSGARPERARADTHEDELAC